MNRKWKQLLWVNPRQYVLKLINKSDKKLLIFASLISPSKKQNSRKLWKTLNELLPNKKQHKTANAPAFENLTATNFDYEFFTSVAEKLCGHYKSKTRLPNILTPRVALQWLTPRVLMVLLWDFWGMQLQL